MSNPYYTAPRRGADPISVAPKANPTFTGVVTLPAGTVSAPGLAFANDPDTGLTHPANDTVALSAGGGSQLTCDTAGVAIGGAGTWLRGSSSSGGQGYLGANVWFDGTAARFVVGHGSLAASGLAVNTPAWNTMALFCNTGGAVAKGTFTPNLMVVVHPDSVAVGGVQGADSLRIAKVANAVNRVLVEGGAVGAAPTLFAAGSDANIHLRLQPKGAGTVVVPTLPKSAAGLPSGALWNDGGTVKIV